MSATPVLTTREGLPEKVTHEPKMKDEKETLLLWICEKFLGPYNLSQVKPLKETLCPLTGFQGKMKMNWHYTIIYESFYIL